MRDLENVILNVKEYEAFFFDHDGLLVDTVTADYLSCCKVFESLNMTLDKNEWEQNVCGNINGYSILFKTLPITVEEAHQRLQHEWDKTFIPANITLMPGVEKLLSTLSLENLYMAVVSAASIEWVERWLKHFSLEKYFSHIESGEILKRNKPFPDVYLAAAEKCNVNPKNCLVFEDSYSGVRAAKAAGMTVVAVTPRPSPAIIDLADYYFQNLDIIVF